MTKHVHTRKLAPSNAQPGTGEAFARLARHSKNAKRRTSKAPSGSAPAPGEHRIMPPLDAYGPGCAPKYDGAP